MCVCVCVCVCVCAHARERERERERERDVSVYVYIVKVITTVKLNDISIISHNPFLGRWRGGEQLHSILLEISYI